MCGLKSAQQGNGEESRPRQEACKGAGQEEG